MPAFILLQCDVCGKPFPLLRVETWIKTDSQHGPSVGVTSPVATHSGEPYEPDEPMEYGPDGVFCWAHSPSARA